jgi:phage terminase small subunit
LATLATTAQALGLTPASRVRLPAQADPDKAPDSAEAFEQEHGSGPA